MFGDVYTTTINVNGSKVFSRTFYPGACCCGGRMFMNSCFGFGYGGFGSGLGFCLGYTAGVLAVPLVPTIVRGIRKGVSSLWNSVFHKKSKAKAEETQKT